MAEKQPRLVRFWPCVCWGSQLLDPTGEQSELITRKIEQKQAISSSSKALKLLQRHDTPAPLGPSTTLNLSNKNLGHTSRHFELGNSSEESGYIQAISPTPSSSHQQASRHGVTSPRQPERRRTPTSPSSFRAAASSPFSPPAGCAADLEREKKHPKIHLKDSWDGLVILHSPKTQEERNDDNGGNNNTSNTQSIERTRSTASPRLLNHHNHHHHHPNSNHTHSHSPRQRHLSPHQENEATTTTTSATAAATTTVEREIDTQLQGPLASPQSFLEEISRLVAINDQDHVISALNLLSRGVRHHNHRLDQCLGELLNVVTACLQSNDDKVVSAALQASTELLRIYGDLLLQHMYAQQEQERERSLEKQSTATNSVFLLQLLILASKSSASSIKSTADTLLKRIASKMHQPSIIKLLEPLAARANTTGNSSNTPPAVQNKAASVLLIATYRLS